MAADPAYATVRAELEAQLAEYQRRYADHPYTGPGTPVPRWGPSAEELAERTTDPEADLTAGARRPAPVVLGSGTAMALPPGAV